MTKRASGGVDEPESVRIGGFTYKIITESSILADDMVGHIDYRMRRITVQGDGLAIVQKKNTVLHEAMHGIDFEIGANDRVSEEENIARTNAMFAFLREPRNRAAIDWIMDESGE
jgi:hypothetical protein